MSEASGSRAERKERTRRAILDATLELCEDAPLAALSLRQVAKQVGIVPTAFYRHFESIEQLGLALVEESFVSLRSMMRALRANATADFANLIDVSIATMVEHVREQEMHYAFIARERFAGPTAVRGAIDTNLVRFVDELATDLARIPVLTPWSTDDLRTLSDLIVTAFVALAERLLATSPGSSAERILTDAARTQVRMLIIGARQWNSSR
ncbi:MAG: TetR family transcriptional regulator [Nocardioidaceae bacterium]|nr:TetR family transcriptional regulator [Nocardioidaceae bacterium]MCL2613546.1 TetR family transcriptional regulator [Nocardioidaceae bacterium]